MPGTDARAAARRTRRTVPACQQARSPGWRPRRGRQPRTPTCRAAPAGALPAGSQALLGRGAATRTSGAAAPSWRSRCCWQSACSTACAPSPSARAGGCGRTSLASHSPAAWRCMRTAARRGLAHWLPPGARGHAVSPCISGSPARSCSTGRRCAAAHRAPVSAMYRPPSQPPLAPDCPGAALGPSFPRVARLGVARTSPEAAQEAVRAGDGVREGDPEVHRAPAGGQHRCVSSRVQVGCARPLRRRLFFRFLPRTAAHKPVDRDLHCSLHALPPCFRAALHCRGVCRPGPRCASLSNVCHL